MTDGRIPDPLDETLQDDRDAEEQFERDVEHLQDERPVHPTPDHAGDGGVI